MMFKWSLITDSDLRGKLISEDYEIVDSLIQKWQRGVIASVKIVLMNEN